MRTMPMKIFFVFLFIGCFFLNCPSKKKQEPDYDVISFLLSQSSPIQTACQKFLLVEGACISTTENTLVACNNLSNSIRSKISPQNLASDSLVELYFNCFSQANTIYNSLITCNKSSFQTNADYRRFQRQTSGSQINANAQWKTYFNNCSRIDNGIPPADSGLREIQSSLTGDPFQ